MGFPHQLVFCAKYQSLSPYSASSGTRPFCSNHFSLSPLVSLFRSAREGVLLVLPASFPIFLDKFAGLVRTASTTNPTPTSSSTGIRIFLAWRMVVKPWMPLRQECSVFHFANTDRTQTVVSHPEGVSRCYYFLWRIIPGRPSRRQTAARAC